jgi:hypothetical protein
MYSAEAIQKALIVLGDRNLRNSMTNNARQSGRTSLNWAKGEEVLYQEYSALMPGGLKRPDREWNEAKAVAGI